MPLTEHQEQIKTEVIEALRAGETRIIICGSAGVGKTVLAGDIIETLRKDHTINKSYNNGIVFCTAPTNKALAVLQSKVKARVEFKTIHSACRVVRSKPDPKTGVRRFVRAKSYGKNEFENAKACVLDECSMLNSDFIGGNDEIPIAYLEDYSFPIIFIGDSKQINPVGEPRSPIFEQGYPTFELTEIIRQGKGNPIIDLSRDLDMIYFKTPNLIDGKGYTYNDYLAGIIDDLAEVNGTDEMKYLAWVRDDVNDMNRFVRERRYGNPAKIEREETIVFDSPFGNFYTNQEVKVQDVEIITEDIPIPRHDTRYNRDNVPITKMDKIRMKYYKLNGTIDVLHEDSEKMFKSISSDLANNCKKQGWNWTGFWAFAERFAEITYNHAITVHKSQGSTYKNAVINIGNINFNKNLEEKERLLYTAVTRASDLVILNNVK